MCVCVGMGVCVIECNTMWCCVYVCVCVCLLVCGSTRPTVCM